MIRSISAFLCVVFVLTLCSSCKSSHSELYGAWYYDSDGQRDAIQFSVNDDGKEGFIWAKYDIENDTVTSISKGYFHISGNEITLDYITSDVDITLEYALEGNTLTLSSGTGELVLSKYFVEE